MVSQTQKVTTVTSSVVDTEVKKGVKPPLKLQLMVTTSWV